jgi:hypothetical protein
MRERAEPHIGREGDLTAGRMSHESESRVGEPGCHCIRGTGSLLPR